MKTEKSKLDMGKKLEDFRKKLDMEKKLKDLRKKLHNKKLFDGFLKGVELDGTGNVEGALKEIMLGFRFRFGINPEIFASNLKLQDAQDEYFVSKFITMNFECQKNETLN